MKTGLTQAQRKQRTSAGLVETARGLFLERGFHATSLDEIAEAAGYSKGAVYSNFGGKAELFLAVLDAHLELRAQAYTEVALDGHDLDETYRAVARFRLEADAARAGLGSRCYSNSGPMRPAAPTCVPRSPSDASGSSTLSPS